MDDIDTPEDRANKMLRYSLILTNFALLCLQENIKKHVVNTDDPKLLDRFKNCIAKQGNLRSPDGPSVLHMAASEPLKFDRRRLDGIQRDDTDLDEDWFSMNNLDPVTSNLFKKWLRLPSVELTKFLIQTGHDVRVVDNLLRWRVIFETASGQKMRCSEQKYPTTLPHELNTPLHIACRQRASSNLISLLAKSGINAFQENKFNKTAFYYLQRSFTIKEVNERFFYDDGLNAVSNSTGEARPRQTRSSVMNRYSVGKEQISNQGTLRWAIKYDDHCDLYKISTRSR